MKIEQISLDAAEALCRKLTASLPDYFGLPEVNEHYAVGVKTRTNFAAKIDGIQVALLSLDFPYPRNGNIYWMAVSPEFQSKGIGNALVLASCSYAKARGAHTMTVETLAPSEADTNYLNTYKFYEACGFEPLFNLKPQGYEWNMVYMAKALEQIMETTSNTEVTISLFTKSDIPIIVAAFAANNWHKPATTFEGYLKEQLAGERVVWVAYHQDQLAGYVTLTWASKYEPFRLDGIPEIMDLNVLPPYRGKGFGSNLLETAELEASKKSTTVGIGVGLYGGPDGGYGSAQRLYVQKGYVPDGRGVTYNYQPVEPGSNLALDDDLVLWFTKRLG